MSVLGSFATLLTATIINVAIPDIMGALGLTIDQAQNLVSAHLAAGTVTMLMTAWAIRAFGIVATYLFNMMLFAVSCIAGGLAMTGEILFLARLVQGAASGIIMPLSMIMIAQVFPVDRRGMAMGWMAVGTVLAPALGPTLGGYLVDNLSWRWVFFMAIPFAVVSLPLALVFFPTREERGPRPSFDWVGVFLCAVFLLSLLTALTEAQSEGWYDDRVTVALGGRSSASSRGSSGRRAWTNRSWTCACSATCVSSGRPSSRSRSARPSTGPPISSRSSCSRSRGSSPPNRAC